MLNEPPQIVSGEPSAQPPSYEELFPNPARPTTPTLPTIPSPLPLEASPEGGIEGLTPILIGTTRRSNSVSEMEMSL